MIHSEANSVSDAKLTYRKAIADTLWADLHHTVASHARIACVTEVQS